MSRKNGVPAPGKQKSSGLTLETAVNRRTFTYIL